MYLVKLVYTHNYTDMNFFATCHEKPPVLRDQACFTEGKVSQDKFHCINVALQFVNSIIRQKCP